MNPSRKLVLFEISSWRSEHDILVEVSADKCLIIAFEEGPSETTTFQRSLIG
jgi:hypothetical protein